MEILIVIAIVWAIGKSVKSGGKVVGSDYQREVKGRRAAVAKAHPDWSERRRNRIAGARAFGATAADLLHLGPAVLRGMSQGWQEARAEWGSTKEEHQDWRARRHGELAARRAARGGKRPSPWSRLKDRAWRAVLGPVPQVALVDPPAPGSADPAKNVVPFPADRKPGSAAPAEPGPFKPGSAAPAPDPGSTPTQPGPGLQPGQPIPDPADPGSTPPWPRLPIPGSDSQAPADAPGPTPAPATAGTVTPQSETTGTVPGSATTGDTDMTTPNSEMGSYEAAQVALRSFAAAAAQAADAADATAEPVGRIHATATGAANAAEAAVASLETVGMSDQALKSAVAAIREPANALLALCAELDALRVKALDEAIRVDQAAKNALANLEGGQGRIAEALAAAPGAAREMAWYGAR